MARSRPMARLLGSVLSIAVASIALASGAVYATFTDADSDSGSVTAGTAEIRLNLTRGLNEVIWSGVGCSSDNLAPGDTCSATLTVFNDGNLGLYYAIEDLGTACFTVTHDPPLDPVNGGDGTNPGYLPGNPAEHETITAHVQVVDLDVCQGSTALVGIRVNGSTSP